MIILVSVEMWISLLIQRKPLYLSALSPSHLCGYLSLFCGYNLDNSPLLVDIHPYFCGKPAPLLKYSQIHVKTRPTTSRKAFISGLFSHKSSILASLFFEYNLNLSKLVFHISTKSIQ